MSRSVLLQLARDSIQEVFEAKNIINKQALLKEHPLLNESIPVSIKIFQEEELKSSYTCDDSHNSLLSKIIIGAKKAAFENGEILTTSAYLHSEIEIILDTPDGQITQKDPAIITSSV